MLCGCKLPTRCLYVLSPAASNGDAHASADELANEPLQSCLVGRAERIAGGVSGAFDPVVNNEVHLARRPTRRGGQVLGVDRRVVDALEDTVLVGHSPAGSLVVVADGLAEGAQVRLLRTVDRH